jgi:membrane protein
LLDGATARNNAGPRRAFGLAFRHGWNDHNFAPAHDRAALAALFAMFFRWFPDGPVTWQDAWRGGLATAVLFNFGKLAIAWYIGRQGLESTYGAAASVVVLLIWVYYSAQIVLFGGEITHVYAQQRTAHKQPT